MPHLLIQYRDHILFDGDVDEFTMADSVHGISVVGKITPARNAASGGSALLELLGRRRTPEPAAQTEPEVEETA